MKLNPFINALLAILYILLVVGIITALQSPNTPDSGILAPVFILSLFTLSAAVMAFLFFYKPLQLYFDNLKKEAFTYFIKTIGYFGAVVLLAFFALLYFRTPDSIIFPKEGDILIQGKSYQITWTGGREEILHISLVDATLKNTNTSAYIVDKIYGVENAHSYTYTVPTTIKPGKYQFQIGDMLSPVFEITPTN